MCSETGWVAASQWTGTIGLAELVVVKLETHAVMNLVVSKGDMILVYGVPLLDPDLVRPRASLSSDKLLQIANRVILTACAVRQRLSTQPALSGNNSGHLLALHPHFLAQPVIQDHFDHDL